MLKSLEMTQQNHFDLNYITTFYLVYLLFLSSIITVTHFNRQQNIFWNRNPFIQYWKWIYSAEQVQKVWLSSVISLIWELQSSSVSQRHRVWHHNLLIQLQNTLTICCFYNIKTRLSAFFLVFSFIPSNALSHMWLCPLTSLLLDWIETNLLWS